MTETDAIAWLVVQVPELSPLLDEHVSFNGELLPYVVFESDFLRWFIGRVRGGESEPARRFVSAIELLMTTDVVPPANDRVWNLAGVCFIEGLQNDSDVVDAVRLGWVRTRQRRLSSSVSSGFWLAADLVLGFLGPVREEVPTGSQCRKAERTRTGRELGADDPGGCLSRGLVPLWPERA